MERIANLHIERLPEGVYLATSDDIPGLIAQGRTIIETLEIARDVAKKLIEAQSERNVANSKVPHRATHRPDTSRRFRLLKQRSHRGFFCADFGAGSAV